MSIAVITGASSGIGQEFAIQIQRYFQDIDEIWLFARRKDRMEVLASKLKQKTRIFKMDFTDDIQLDQIKEIFEISKPDIKMLINCSGFGIMGKFKDLSLDEQINMIDLNCKALTKMTYYCIPYMGNDSRIIQLASVAAFLPQPNFTIYAASKSYVLSFSRALSEELRNDNIYVTAICPGPVRTEFFGIAEKYGSTLKIKKFVMVSVDKVVKGALKASKRKKKIYTCSIPMKLMHFSTKIFPTSWILFFLRLMK